MACPALLPGLLPSKDWLEGLWEMGLVPVLLIPCGPWTTSSIIPFVKKDESTTSVYLRA